MHVNDLLKIAVESGASDLHLKVGSFPMMRVRGTLTPANDDKKLDHEDVVAMSAAVMSTTQRQKFKETQEVDLAYSVPGLGRFRCNIFQQRGTVGLVLRVIPMQIRTIDELGLPPVLKTIAAEERGLVLVTGTTGSGKSTTLAAMIDYINKTRSAHVMTVEDPIEFLHRDNKSMVNQREVAVDTRSFAQALRSALRQDPDVILVGEMRDFETIETGLLAAETGHLVFSTLHTLDATETINRIISVFPPHQQKQIRLQLASVLKAVVSQRLMPKSRRQGPRAGGRSADQHALHPRLHRRQGEDAPDPRRDRRGHVAVRDADVRSVDLQPVRAEAGVLRGGAALGEQRRRVQAAGPGHLDDLRHEPRPDGPGGRCRTRKSRASARRCPPPTSTASRCSDAASCPSSRCASASPARNTSQDDIDEAVARLREERAINDQRVAEAIARTETGIRKRGKVRVRMQLERAGIAKDTAKQAIDSVFEAIDDDALLESSLRKRLRGRETIADDREFARLFRYLIGQGFESDRVMKALKAYRIKG